MQTKERSFRLQADSMSHAALTHTLQVTALLGWRGPRDREPGFTQRPTPLHRARGDVQDKCRPRGRSGVWVTASPRSSGITTLGRYPDLGKCHPDAGQLPKNAHSVIVLCPPGVPGQEPMTRRCPCPHGQQRRPGWAQHLSETRAPDSPASGVSVNTGCPSTSPTLPGIRDL